MHNKQSTIPRIPQLFAKYVLINEETDRERDELEAKFISSQKTLFDLTSVKHAEQLIDNAFESHSIRQAALIRRKKQRIIYDKFEFEECHLRFLVETLIEHEVLQQRHLESGLEIDQKGMNLNLLIFLFEKKFGKKMSTAKLYKFISMREYSRTFKIFSYKITKRPRVEFVSLLSTKIPRFVPLPLKVELEHSSEHVALVRYIIENNGTEWIKIGKLKDVLMNKYDVKPVHIKEFLEKYKDEFVVGKYKQSLSVRLITQEEYNSRVKESNKEEKSENELDTSLEEEQIFDLPDFELPKDFEVTVSHNEKIIQRWIYDNIHLPLLEQDNIIVGIDSEWSIIHLNHLAIINPHLFHNLSRKNRLKEHDHHDLPDLLQISTDKKCLLLQTLGGEIRPPEELVRMFSDARVLKIFCNYASDLAKLRNWFELYRIDISMPGLIDIDEKGVGCSRLCAEKLKMNYTKQRSLQLSRWSKRELSAEQKDYAAKDAYLNVLFYKCDPSMAKIVSDTPKKKAQNVNHLVEPVKEVAN
jgi:hypothetical protein